VIVILIYILWSQTCRSYLCACISRLILVSCSLISDKSKQLRDVRNINYLFFIFAFFVQFESAIRIYILQANVVNITMA
jgi:hypothetical protein